MQRNDLSRSLAAGPSLAVRSGIRPLRNARITMNRCMRMTVAVVTLAAAAYLGGRAADRAVPSAPDLARATPPPALVAFFR